MLLGGPGYPREREKRNRESDAAMVTDMEREFR